MQDEETRERARRKREEIKYKTKTKLKNEEGKRGEKKGSKGEG